MDKWGDVKWMEERRRGGRRGEKKRREERRGKRRKERIQWRAHVRKKDRVEIR